MRFLTGARASRAPVRAKVPDPTDAATAAARAVATAVALYGAIAAAAVGAGITGPGQVPHPKTSGGPDDPSS